jgi:hypothetical protein
MTHLTYEIVKRIFSDIGVTSKSLNNNGLINDKLKLNDTINIKYDGQGIVKHSMYAGSISFNKKANMGGILIDLCYQEYSEYLFAFKLDSQPVYITHILFDNIDDCYIKVFNDKTNKWFDAPIYMQASILSGFERINDFGILWGDYEGNLHDLKSLIVSFVELYL